jgi:hypothetical protein
LKNDKTIVVYFVEYTVEKFEKYTGLIDIECTVKGNKN